MKTLVTGGAGFIGSHVVDRLHAAGADVLVIDSLDPGVHRQVPDYLRHDVSYCFSDLRYWIPDSRFDDVEAVVHLAALGGVGRAAREPSNVVTANCGGTARLLEIARSWKRLRKFVQISSFSIYGANYRYRCDDCGGERNAQRRTADLEHGLFEVLCTHCGRPCRILPIDESAVPDPLDPYGASKYMQELCLRGLQQCPTITLRLSSAYGTRLRLDDSESTIIARLAGWIRAGVAPRLFEDGAQIRDWVYVGDVTDTVLAAFQREAPPVVNVCSGVATTLLEACCRLSEVTGVHVEPEIVGGFRPGDMRHCLGQPAAMQALLGRPPIPFSEGAGLAFGARAVERAYS